MQIVGLLALLAAVLAGCGGNAPVEVAQAETTPALSEPAGPVMGTLAFAGSELKFAPATVQVDRPGRYAVTFTNEGHIDHDWVGGGVRLIAKPGETVRGEIDVPAAGLEFICSGPGHAAGGMQGRITVQEAASD